MSLFVRCDKCKEEFKPTPVQLILPDKEGSKERPFVLWPISRISGCGGSDYDLCWHCIKQLLETHLANHP